ncbi:MAG: NAD(+)/NADH kinase [Clostridiales bacterium]|nr:NAD(+)/NADH kinase [Clostridiales bacterium]
MKVSRVGVWVNRQKAGAAEVADRLVRALERRQVEACMDRDGAELLGRPDCGRGYEGCDLIAVLGGDGTIMTALGVAVALDLPLLGVNLGRVGFLSEVEPAAIERGVDRLLAGDVEIERRMLLDVKLPNRPVEIALNDALFTREACSMRVIALEAFVDGRLAARFAGDGLIVATPTGSTAYSFSAGGPVVAPGLDAIVLTPICPHSMGVRAMVLPPTAVVELRAAAGADSQVVIDGQRVRAVEANRSVRIGRSERVARFIRLNERDFFQTLKGKLTDWNT